MNKTTKPAKRIKITKKINRIQTSINTLAGARQDDIDSTSSRYAARTSSLKSKFASRIGNVRSRARNQIAREKREWRQIYRDQLAAAKDRRGNEFGLVNDLRQRGAGLIKHMPEATPNP